MGTQPLDAAFAARQENSKKSSRRIVVLGALFVGLAGTAASVYAANVNINSANDIVFAQGIEEVVTCDTDGATTDIASTFNAATGVFSVSDVTISGLMDGCVGAAIDVYLTNGTDILGTVVTTSVTDGETDINTTVADFSGLSIDASAVTDVAVEIRG
jgi:hypothetical protein